MEIEKIITFILRGADELAFRLSPECDNLYLAAGMLKARQIKMMGNFSIIKWPTEDSERVESTINTTNGYEAIGEFIEFSSNMPGNYSLVMEYEAGSGYLETNLIARKVKKQIELNGHQAQWMTVYNFIISNYKNVVIIK